MLFGVYNSAQKVVDGVSVITDAVSSVSAPPAKMLTDWVNDRFIAPSYWRPNSEITVLAERSNLERWLIDFYIVTVLH